MTEQGALFMDKIDLGHQLEVPLQAPINHDYALLFDNNTARALPLLRRTLFWSKILQACLRDCSIRALQDHFSELCVIDADTAFWVLQHLRPRLHGYNGRKDEMIKFHVSIINQEPRHDVQTAATLNLSLIFEQVIDRGDERLDDLKTLAVDCYSLKDLPPLQRLPTMIANREMLESNMRLQSCLLTLDALTAKEHEAAYAIFPSQTQRWAVNLHYALSEGLVSWKEAVFQLPTTDYWQESSTRYAAVRSLASFKYALKRPEGIVEKDHFFLEVYVFLYDMLNDDDEEIRDLAAKTASWILSDSMSSLRKNMAYSPLRAAGYLIELIADCYSSSPDLCRIAIERILGQKYRQGLSSSAIPFRAVEDIVREHHQDSTVLFEAEKQNLFADEIREAANWSNALLQLEEAAFEDDLLRSLNRWVSQGLEYLVNMASSAAEDGPLGWTSKSEIYIVGMQLISAASVFVAGTSPILSRFSHEKEMISSQLDKLLEHGNKISLHPHWLSRIEYVLSSR
jgi:hypothetical protein